MRLFLILLGPLVLALAIVGFLSLTRGTPVKMVVTEGDEGPPPPTDSLFERTMELFTGTHISPDNTVEQLLNGDETYPRLWQDLRAAQSTITVQMYYTLPGSVSDTMAAILKERARAGVRTLFILDGFGSLGMPRSWVESLREAGVEVEVIRKLKWYTLHHATDRPHARAVVIDGRIGYTGGFGLADYWLGDGRQDGQWRETNVRFTGPAVMQLQSAFASAWAETRGELLTGELFFPRSGFQPTGTVHAGLMYTSPTAGSTPGERFFALTIAGARHRLYIANSYFVPDTDFRRLLQRAAARGVDVRILTVGPKTDIKTTRFAGRYRYEELLAAGVRIYEYQPTMMHAKSLVADGIWCAIGSMNFDNRSMAFNTETKLVVLDSTLGAEMEREFFRDLEFSREWTLEDMARRPVWERAVEAAAAIFSRLL